METSRVLRSNGKRKIPPNGKRKIPPKIRICMVNRLPSDIITEILSRLPTASILDCRRVCKTWRNLIRHPYFAHMHLRRNGNNFPCESSDTGAMFDFGFLFLLRTGPPKGGYLVYYGEFDDQTDKKLRRLNQPTIGYLSIAGSRNGLICFSDSNYFSYIHEPIYISNPITGEYMNLPRLEVNGENKVDSLVCGFGYVPSIDKYKIVRIYYIQNQPMGQVQVYTLGGGSGWRDIGETAYSLRHIKDGSRCGRCPFGAFVNGALHWLDEERKIVSFDLAEEKLYLLTLPPIVTDLNLKNSFRLQVLGGCLSFIHQLDNKASDIWIYRSDSVNEQDSKLSPWIKILHLPTDGSPFALRETGELLIWYEPSTICSYDLRTEAMEKLVFNGKFFNPVPHMNSFISLKSLGENCQLRERYPVNPSPTKYFIEQDWKDDEEEFDYIVF